MTPPGGIWSGLIVTVFISCHCLAKDERTEVQHNGWVEGRVQSLSLEDKIGQMFMVSIDGTEMTENVAAQLDELRFGNVILFAENMKSWSQTRKLISDLQTHTIIRSGVPMFVAVDQEGGLVNRIGAITDYPVLRHSARTLRRAIDYNPKARELINQISRKIANGMRSLGFNMNLAPVLDLSGNPTSYIYSRSFGRDPKKVTAMAADLIRIMKHHGIVSTGKHFPSLGDSTIDSHLDLPILNRSIDELMGHELVPYRQLKSSLGAVMIGHVQMPIFGSRPASLSKKAISLLRKNVGFRGLVMTDDIKMRALTKNFSLQEIVLGAVTAGADMIIMAWTSERKRAAAKFLLRAVKGGWISEERIDASVRRILQLKHEYIYRRSPP